MSSTLPSSSITSHALCSSSASASSTTSTTTTTSISTTSTTTSTATNTTAAASSNRGTIMSSLNIPGSPKTPRTRTVPTTTTMTTTTPTPLSPVGPRPLHLLDIAAGSSSQSTSTIPSPSSWSHHGLSPGTPGGSTSPSPKHRNHHSIPSTPTTAAAAGSTLRGGAPNPKRQSTLSYFAPDHVSVRDMGALSPSRVDGDYAHFGRDHGPGKRASTPTLASVVNHGSRPASVPSGGGVRASVEALVPASVALGSPGVREEMKTWKVGVGGSGNEEKVLGSPRMQMNLEKERDMKERPLTVGEKHTELLHFIAQKEALCLELRSQLAMHEEELLQLKRKWERIVNRGLDRSTSSSPYTPSSSTSTSFSFAPSSSSSSSSAYTTLTSPSLPTSPSPSALPKDIPAALMSLTTNPALTLEGIREGVQGMSRLLAAGLNIAGGGGDAYNSYSPTTTTGSKTSAKLTGPGPSTASPMLVRSPLSVSSTTANSTTSTTRQTTPRSGRSRHEQRESDSASSAATRSSGSAYTSVDDRDGRFFGSDSRRSSGCGSAATSVVDDHDEHEQRDKIAGTDDSNANAIPKDERLRTSSQTPQNQHQNHHHHHNASSSASASTSSSATRTRSMTSSPQELMMSDTGATPTMSLNPAFLEQRARRRRRALERRDQSDGNGPQTNSNKGSGGGVRDGKSGSGNGIAVVEGAWEVGTEGMSSSWDDKEAWDTWGEVEVEDHADASGKGQETAKERKKHDVQGLWAALEDADTRAGGAAPLGGPGSMAPASSIPTLGGLSPQQVSSWMGTVGKKIGGEFQKSSDAISRSQKRASLMLSDMSQSFVSALVSPGATPDLGVHSSAASRSGGSLTGQEATTMMSTMSSMSSRSTSGSTSPGVSPSLLAGSDPMFGLVSPVLSGSVKNGRRRVSERSAKEEEEGAEGTRSRHSLSLSFSLQRNLSAGKGAKAGGGSLLDDDDDDEGRGDDRGFGKMVCASPSMMGVMVPDNVKAPPKTGPGNTSGKKVDLDSSMDEWNW